MTNLWLRVPRTAQILTMLALIPGLGLAESCFAPARPFVPNDSKSLQEYADLLSRDFENYFRDIQGYFRCLDRERARAFEEAQEVSEEYGQFLHLQED